MPTIVPSWSTPVSDVQARLRKLETVLKGAERADGSVDLQKARQLAGKDIGLMDLVRSVRVDREKTLLGPADAKRAFMELQVAIQTAPDKDFNHDGKLGFRELPFYDRSDDPAQRLIFRAAMPVETRDGERPRPRVQMSLAARREAEQVITQTASFHAASPLGAEALAWSMRLDIAQGMDIKDPIVFDAVNFSESDWRAKLPLIGKHYLGRGHLSDKELTTRFGDLQSYVEKTRAAVNGALMMDYQSEFLAGVDLP